MSTNPPKIPFGALDNPGDGATVKGNAVVDGWALFEDGVDHISIYIDRNYVQDAPVKGRREDVVKVFPDFAAVTDMAYRTEIPTDKLTPGRHEISARVVGRNGSTRDLVPRLFNVAK